MITAEDLQEAIAECEGERNPNANTCIKLAAFYTIRNELYPDEPSPIKLPQYSYAEPTISYSSNSEFGQMVYNMEWDDVMYVMDELMDTLRVMMPRLYDGVMRKLREV